MTWLVLVLLTMILFLNGILFRQADTIFYLLALSGLVLFFKERPVLPSAVIQYIKLSFLFLFYLTIYIAVTQVDLLFEWRYETYRFILLLPFIAWAVFSLKLDGQVFWRLIVLSSSFSFFWVGLIFYSGEFTRSFGYLTDPINRGNMGMFHGLLCLVALFAIKGKAWKALAAILFLSGVILSLLSGSRGGWLALFISWITLIILFYKFNLRHYMVGLLSLLMIVFVSTALLWDYLPIAGKITQTLNALELYQEGELKTSLGYRFELWKASINGFLEKPILGWGWDNYPDAWYFYLEKFQVPLEINFGHPHNQYFLFLTELGVLGLGVFLTFFLYPAYYAFKVMKRKNVTSSQVFFIALILVMTESLMEFMLSDDPLSKKYYLITFLIISLIGLKNLSDKKP